ncbi:phytoene desaturase family protein [Actinomadura scrupuli]|uniref:phytoene desaturase family protein n=1 Tax=Actinomadura scrupuli TaxID=559629 RepID=UPI003D97F0FB
MDEVDAVVIGSGINGLVAAAELAKAGWAVALVERNQDVGGFIATEERTLPGYLHDTYSSWHPLFVSGGAYASLGELLHRHGLEYRNTDDWVAASVADDGSVTLAHRDPVRTAAEFAHEADKDAYLDCLNRLGQAMGPIGGLLSAELRSPALLRHAAGLIRSGGRTGLEGWLRSVTASGRGWARERFRGDAVDHLYSPWLLHAGLSPDHASGGFMAPLRCDLARVRAAGGRRRRRAVPQRLPVAVRLPRRPGRDRHHGRARDRQRRSCRGGDGRRPRHPCPACRTRLRDPTALYGGLLPEGSVDSRFREEATRFRYGRAAMQIHVALSEPIGWRDERLSRVPLIHLADGSGSIGIACAEAEAGLLPRRPTVVVGRQYLLDPGRVPEGTAALWLQLQEVPFAPRGDAAGELDTSRGWTPELARGYADRVLDRIAQHAPDLRDKVLALDVITPVQLTAHNPNAVNGDPYGGAGDLDQSYLWRPLPSSGRHATDVSGLWHIGASTHPGAGLGGSSGHMVATALTKPRRFLARAR